VRVRWLRRLRFKVGEALRRISARALEVKLIGAKVTAARLIAVVALGLNRSTGFVRGRAFFAAAHGRFNYLWAAARAV
jgi:hypothetical protein